ncbi:hypothetical protein OEZ86_005221 [Tetradesmus obliquus]|nr:hypothetical protein OEZ86_005221 [Tetradesmus obliquus]
MVPPAVTPLQAFKAALDYWQQDKEDMSWLGTRLWVYKKQAADGSTQLELPRRPSMQPSMVCIDNGSCTNEAEAAAIYQQLQQTDLSQLRALILRMPCDPQQLHCRRSLASHLLPGELRYLDLAGNGCVELSLWSRNQPHLRVVDLSNCRQLNQLSPHLCSLEKLTNLSLRGCQQLALLPDEFGELQALQVLVLDNSGILELPASFGELTELPETFGHLKALQSLEMKCPALQELPQSMKKLAALTKLDLQGCISLAQPLPDSKWPPKQQIEHVLSRQDIPAVVQLATQQETMLTTLERMSWLVVLLATATFIGFMQPPGGVDTDSKQVLALVRSSHLDWQCTTWQL